MKTLSILLLLFFSVNSIEPQSFTESKRVILESNNITTEVWNYGSIGSIGGFANLRWNGLKYISEFGIMISAEVVSAEGDTIHITSDSFLNSYSGDYNPSYSEKWGWLPVEGYSNSNSSEIANSVNLASWPEDWSFWPGEYGLGKIIAENEAYYVMNDFNNAEFNYFPSSTNPLMRGLGVSSEVRTYQFGGGLEDALIIKYFITNESDKLLQKVYL